MTMGHKFDHARTEKYPANGPSLQNSRRGRSASRIGVSRNPEPYEVGESRESLQTNSTHEPRGSLLLVRKVPDWRSWNDRAQSPKNTIRYRIVNLQESGAEEPRRDLGRGIDVKLYVVLMENTFLQFPMMQTFYTSSCFVRFLHLRKRPFYRRCT